MKIIYKDHNQCVVWLAKALLLGFGFFNGHCETSQSIVDSSSGASSTNSPAAAVTVRAGAGSSSLYCDYSGRGSVEL